MNHVDTLEQCVVKAMDGSDPGLFAYLPEILQDFDAIGSDPDVVAQLVKEFCSDPTSIRVLDLGCGKGTVSLYLAQHLGCRCHGIDAIPAFVEQALLGCREHKLEALCSFTVGDVRREVEHLSGFDVVILGATGPIWGDYTLALNAVKNCLVAGGAVVLDEGYIPEGSSFSHPRSLPHRELLYQIEKAGMRIVCETRFDGSDGEAYDKELALLTARCNELALKFPEHKALFANYADEQKQEFEHMRHRMICSTFLLVSS